MSYSAALAEAHLLGAAQCSNPALMAQFLDANVSFLIGAVSPELIWNGAQKQGMTAKAVVDLVYADPMAAAHLMFA